jgi:5-methylcytosine-specific restriction endonuclease McrA
MPYKCKVKEARRQMLGYRRKKAKAVKLKGGSCEMCGYDKHPAALQFHHIRPSEKSFGIGCNMHISWSRLEKEVSKCQLLCGNCHAIVTCEGSRKA